MQLYNIYSVAANWTAATLVLCAVPLAQAKRICAKNKGYEYYRAKNCAMSRPMKTKNSRDVWRKKVGEQCANSVRIVQNSQKQARIVRELTLLQHGRTVYCVAIVAIKPNNSELKAAYNIK